ncbi:hypothetical protein [Moorena sp. SIO4G3]|uniref:hypothetical protein n=1 Tax=Moorena sp. SIO4G3 TaxID=2607821 RepID=UPI00142C1156|nr:hypothetical protein [Moorena sp. SIO4G3]NEO80223.1 hypothetical protein [Moorena sp. SIO4G3]
MSKPQHSAVSIQPLAVRNSALFGCLPVVLIPSASGSSPHRSALPPLFPCCIAYSKAVQCSLPIATKPNKKCALPPRFLFGYQVSAKGCDNAMGIVYPHSACYTEQLLNKISYRCQLTAVSFPGSKVFPSALANTHASQVQ